MKNWYDIPTQVKWMDEEENIHGGIAFGDTMVCACCGGAVPLDEANILKELEWISLDAEILGDEG